MSVEREANELSKFVPAKLPYEIVSSIDKARYQRTLSVISEENTTARRGTYHQVLSTFAVLLLAAACGMPNGYSAVLLPQLTNTNATAEIAIDIEMGSWIASVHCLATPFGSFISGPLSDHIGRRATLLLAVLPIFAGWAVLALSKSYSMLLVGRMLCGFATGTLGGPTQVYIAETTDPNLRGLLIGAPFVSYSIGIFIVYVLGATLHWREVAWCSNILPALAAFSLFFIPESPVWLLRNKRLEEAKEALIFLRGSEIAAQKEINMMSERLKKERATTKTHENIFKLCCQRIAIKPLIIVITFALLQMCTGSYVVVFYAIDIISEFGVDFDMNTVAIWTAVVRTLCALTFCIMLLFVRRRCLLILSGIGSGLSCLVLSIYMYARVNETKSNLDVIVAASCLLVYIAFNTTLMVMPGIMVGKLFPARIRGRTAGAVFAAINIALFGITKAFPLIQAAVKMRGVFMIFAISSFVVAIFMFMFQPETKGWTLDQIEDYFNEKNWLWFRRDKPYRKVKIVLPDEQA